MGKRIYEMPESLSGLSDSVAGLERTVQVRTRTEEWDERFIIALRELVIVNYYLDMLLFGESADKEAIVREKGEEIENIERKCKRYFNERGKDLIKKMIHMVNPEDCREIRETLNMTEKGQSKIQWRIM